MTYVLFKNGIPTGVSDVPYSELEGKKGVDFQNRHDWKTFDEVCKIARYLTAIIGNSFVGVDHGDGCFPRYDVMELPTIGDKVSYCFNGDYYPDGEITKITKTFQITTSGGHTYRRKKNTSTWLQPGGTWGLVQGHHSDKNPSF